MQPRPLIYDTYWRFAAERQAIFFRGLSGASPPYSTDPIFTTYKFCNAYRASDRVSQYLIGHVLYGQEASHFPADTLFRVFLFRLLNKPQTWEKLEKAVGGIHLDSFTPGRYAPVLEGLRATGTPIYGNAFILCATKAYGFDQKHRNHLALLEDVFTRQEIGQQLVEAPSLRALFNLLRSLPLMGDFMAYQVAIDMNYSTVFDFDEDDFTVPGPGAVRGIAKCFADTAGYAPAEVIRSMVDSQEAEFARLGLDFQTLFGRRLHAIDCQGLFCETDKYCRVAFPELASNRVRIKAAFQENQTPIAYLYPPKWGLVIPAQAG